MQQKLAEFFLLALFHPWPIHLLQCRPRLLSVPVRVCRLCLLDGLTKVLGGEILAQRCFCPPLFLWLHCLEMLYLRWTLTQCNQPHWPLAFNYPLILSPCQLHQEFPSSHPSKCLPCSMLLNLSVPMETEVSYMAPLLAYRLKSTIFNVKYSVRLRALWAKPSLANLLGLVAVRVLNKRLAWFW